MERRMEVLKEIPDRTKRQVHLQHIADINVLPQDAQTYLLLKLPRWSFSYLYLKNRRLGCLFPFPVVCFEWQTPWLVESVLKAKEKGSRGWQSCVRGWISSGCCCSGPPAAQALGLGWPGLTAVRYWQAQLLLLLPWMFPWRLKEGTSGARLRSGVDLRPLPRLPRWQVCPQGPRSHLLRGCCPCHPTCTPAGRTYLLECGVKHLIRVYKAISHRSFPKRVWPRGELMGHEGLTWTSFHTSCQSVEPANNHKNQLTANWVVTGRSEVEYVIAH